MKLIFAFSRSLLFVVSGFLIIIATPVGLWLLFSFQTIVGLLFALLGLVAPFFGLSLYYYLKRGHPRPLKLAVGLGTATLLLLPAILLAAPSGQTGPDAPISHQYSHGGRFYRYSLLNLIPEIEQMNVGINIVGPADPYIDRAKADRLSELTLGMYAEMEANADFSRLGSVMAYPLRESVYLPFDNGHYFLYVPDSLDKSQPAPAIVFLHGAGGPFKAYQWVWRRFAEAHGYVIISPTFGFGNWWEPEGTDVVLRALDHAGEIVPIDTERVWLAGLSNGGYGTILIGRDASDRFQGLILFSPGLPSLELVDPQSEFNQLWRDRPILLLSGEADLRMPLDYINQHIDFIQVGGADLTVKLYPEEDHFLFFSQSDQLMSELHDWIVTMEEGQE